MVNKRKRGRPPKYHDLYVQLVYELCSRGASDKDLAYCLGVSKSTINRWKKKPDFWDSLKRGKINACCEVVEALYQRAIGYETTETRTHYDAQGKVYKIVTITKWVHADVRAARFILETKYPELWKK